MDGIREFSRLLQIGVLFHGLVLSISSAVIFRYGPTDTVMAAGKTAVLQCAVYVQNTPEPVSWFHVETNQVLSQDENVLTQEERYSVIGNRDGRGEYYLTIRNVQRSDEGEYRCTSGLEYRSAELKVIVPPPQDYPICDVDPAPTANQPGQLAQLTCTSNGGHPPARLTWKRQGIIISPMINKQNQLQRVVYEEDNGVPYTCYASSIALEYPRTCTVMVLNVPPSAEIKPLEPEVRAGDTASFECFGHGIPEVTSYQWLVNYSPVKTATIPRYSVDKTNRTLTISNIRRWEHGSLIICEVSIKSGLKGRATSRLNVHTAPVTVGRRTHTLLTLAPTVHPPNIYHPADPKGSINISSHTGALIGSIIGTLLLVTIVLLLAFLVMKAKLNQMGVDIVPFTKKDGSKSPKGDDKIPIYAKPNKVRKEDSAPPLPDAPRPDRSTLTRMVTLPRVGSCYSTMPNPKQKVKKHFSNYERIDLVQRRVSFLETKNDYVVKELTETDLNLVSTGDGTSVTNTEGLVYADLELERKRGISAPDVVSSNRPDMVAYAQLRL